MNAFLLAIEDDTHILARPFESEETIQIEGDKEQIDIIRELRLENREEPIIVFYDEETLMLEVPEYV
uniref:hypothetical protein n=1 Tax=Roseburia sp. TaxID=2049040 RepID=UPI003FEE0630